MKGLRYIVLLTCASFIFTQDPPVEFQHNTSEQQAFYFFISVTINGQNITSDDWVGAFNGDICVGTRQWDTSKCGNGICEVPVLGDTGSSMTNGYCNAGDIPTFKIFDVSENIYYDAIPSEMEDLAWVHTGMFNISNLYSGQEPCIDSNGLHHGNVGSLSDCSDGSSGCDCNDICGGSAFLDDCENCVGGNTSFSSESFKDQCGVCGTGATGPGPQVQCWDSTNLYCSIDDCSFNPADCLEGTTFGNYLNNDICGPDGFSSVSQSSSQAFYLITSVTIAGTQIDSEDWVGAFNGDVCVGARKWNTSECGGGICDVPVYGDMGTNDTEGYCNVGDIPTFKIFDVSENKYLNAVSSENIPSWSNNTTRQLTNLNAPGLSVNGLSIPNSYSISNIYPNPFNPITSITYEIPNNSYVSIIAYDLTGNKITSLINNFQNAGYHTINWNASKYPSGVYLIRLESGEFIQTQKVVLVK